MNVDPHRHRRQDPKTEPRGKSNFGHLQRDIEDIIGVLIGHNFQEIDLAKEPQIDTIDNEAPHRRAHVGREEAEVYILAQPESVDNTAGERNVQRCLCAKKAVHHLEHALASSEIHRSILVSGNEDLSGIVGSIWKLV